MSKAITIRDVPEATCNELAARAASNGQSMQEYLRRMLIEQARGRSNREAFRAARERAKDWGVHLSGEEIVELVREGRK